MLPISDMLHPVSDTRPCGDDLCFTSDFDAIANARRYDDPSLDQGEWVTELKEADWPFVVEHTSALLRSRSKDLRLAVWFAEANAKTHGLMGLADGFELIAGLCDRYWEDLHPLADGGDQEQRIGNLAWILSRSIQLFREMPLTEGRSTGYSMADFEAARLRALQTEKALAEGMPPPTGTKLTDMESARRRSSRAFMEKLLQEARHCRDALAALEKAVDVRLGIDGPGFSGARSALDEVTGTISRFAQDIGVRNTPVQQAKADTVQNESGAAGSLANETATASISPVLQQINHGPIQSRNQALAQLREVADYFRRTEPHSPVAYLAEKAADWGELPLHAWLKSVIKDGASLAHVEELLGMAPKETGVP